MPLADFILANLEPILEEWEKHARSIPSAAGQQRPALRDHANRVLRSIAADMAKPQTEGQQRAKSRGGGPETEVDAAAEVHAIGRQSEGFTLMEMVSEYRALRASVIRLWTDELDSADLDTVYELTRFNEAMDQALTESTSTYSEHLDRSRQIFLGVLGHDLRSPLGAVLTAAELLLETDLSDPQRKATETIARSARRIADMASDLLDVTRTRLGQSLPLEAVTSDLGAICQQGVEEARAHHPKSEILLQRSGELEGSWDPARLAQLLSNLVENAIRHGAPGRPVTVAARGAEDRVEVSVHNEGAPIPASQQRRIFDLMVQSTERVPDAGRGAGLGLGLFIAHAIAEAHGGCIDVRSSEADGTTFLVSLPRSHRVRPS